MRTWTGAGVANRPQSLGSLHEAAVRYLVRRVGACTAETIATAAVDLLQAEFTVPNETLLGMLAPRQDQATELGDRVVRAACLRVLEGDENLVQAHFHALLIGCHEWFTTLVDALYAAGTKDLVRDAYDTEIARLTKLEVVLLAWRRQWHRGRTPRRATADKTIYDASFIAEQLNGLRPGHPFYRDADALRARAQSTPHRISHRSLRRRLGRIDPFRPDEAEQTG